MILLISPMSTRTIIISARQMVPIHNTIVLMIGTTSSTEYYFNFLESGVDSDKIIINTGHTTPLKTNNVDSRQILTHVRTTAIKTHYR